MRSQNVPNAMSLLHISVLGPFHASIDGQPVEFATDKVRALLLYLALESDMPHRRDSLAALLYPEWSDSDALNNLRKTLFRLRSALEGHHPTIATTLLTVTRPTILLHAETVSVDALQFRQVVAQSRNPFPRSNEILEQLATVALLYRGELATGLTLGDAEPFEEWLLLQREALHQQALHLCEQVATGYEQRGHYGKALEFARKVLHLEPWREEAHLRLMRLFAADGQRDEALAQFERCRQWLDKELGIAPAESTLALATQIQSGTFQPHPTVDILPPRITLHGFPAHLTSFVGREEMLESVMTQLCQPDSHLITLVGAGGMGKTRLSIQIARQLVQRHPELFPHGYYFVACAPFTQENDVLAEIAATVGFLPQGMLSLLEQVQNYLSEKKLFIILDNLEQVQAGSDMVAKLLAKLPEIKILVTSREPLRIQSEWCYRVEGLSVEGGKEGSAYELFVRRARQVVPTFTPTSLETEAIERIAALVDGSPLALEIAATWVRFYSCNTIESEIRREALFLETEWSDMPARHRSIRAVFDHSWQLLTSTEQMALQNLSVFQGEWRLPQGLAIARCTPQDLVRLGDKSLVSRTKSGRYILHEMVRQFAFAHLEQSATRAEIQQRHAEFFLEGLRNYRTALFGMEPQSAVSAIRQEWSNIKVAWSNGVRLGLWEALLGALDAYKIFVELVGLINEAIPDITSMAGASHHSICYESHVAQGAAAATVADFYYQLRNYPLAIQYAEIALALPSVPELARWRGTAWMIQGAVQVATGRLEQAEPFFEIAEHAYRESGYDLGLAHLISMRAQLLAKQVQSEAAITLHEKALRYFERLQFPLGIFSQLSYIGILYLNHGEFDKARLHYERSLKLAEPLNVPADIGRMYNNMGVVHTYLGNYDTAIAYYEQAMEIEKQAGYKAGVVMKIGNIGLVYRRQRRYSAALQAFQEAVAMARQLGLKGIEANYLGCQGGLYAEMGDFEQAKRDLETCIEVARQHQSKLIEATYGRLLARTLYHSGRIANAFTLLDEVIASQREYQRPQHLALALYEKANLLYDQQLYEHALQAVNEAAALRRDTSPLDEGRWQPEILAARLRARGDKKYEAISSLEQLLEQVEGDEARADVLFRLWEVTNREEYRIKAIQLYQQLSAEAPLYEFRIRLKQLKI